MFDVFGADEWQRLKSLKLPVDEIDNIFDMIEATYRLGFVEGHDLIRLEGVE